MMLDVTIRTEIPVDDVACEVLNAISSHALADVIAERINRPATEIVKALNGVHCETARVMRAKGGDRCDRCGRGGPLIRLAGSSRPLRLVALFARDPKPAERDVGQPETDEQAQRRADERAESKAPALKHHRRCKQHVVRDDGHG